MALDSLQWLVNADSTGCFAAISQENWANIISGSHPCSLLTKLATALCLSVALRHSIWKVTVLGWFGVPPEWLRTYFSVFRSSQGRQIQDSARDDGAIRAHSPSAMLRSQDRSTRGDVNSLGYSFRSTTEQLSRLLHANQRTHHYLS